MGSQRSSERMLCEEWVLTRRDWLASGFLIGCVLSSKLAPPPLGPFPLQQSEERSWAVRRAALTIWAVRVRPDMRRGSGCSPTGLHRMAVAPTPKFRAWHWNHPVMVFAMGGREVEMSHERRS